VTVCEAGITVIVPAHNAARTIEATLDSILSQSLRPNQMLVVNDGSTDQTAIKARAKGVTVLDQVNQGVSAARNFGISKTATDWVAFVDSDDLWSPEKLELQKAAIRADPSAGAVFTDFWQFDDARCINRSVVHEVHRNFSKVRREEIQPDVWRCDSSDLCDLLPEQFVTHPSTLLVRTELLRSIGGFNETLGFSEDLELSLRLLAVTNVLFVDKPLVGYRRHASNASRNLLQMRSGNIDVADIVLRSPSRYRASTVDWYARERPAIVFRGGRMAVAHGNLELGRRWLLESWRARKRLPTFLWIAVSYVAGIDIVRKCVDAASKAWFARGDARTRPAEVRAGDV
jgi:glycosyltransferase involved in cell wall biosynthesis